MKTEFAPAERLDQSEIGKIARRLAAVPLFDRILGAVPELILVLESHRQIVFVNRAVCRYFGIDDPSPLLGRRPGEILDCIHASETDAGCGTTQFCRTCGAVNAILKALGGEKAIEECRITQKEAGNALEFRVWTTPLVVADVPVTIFALRDITDEKRRQVLERMFFHDLLNTAGALKTALDVFDPDSCPSDESRELLMILKQGAEILLEEIDAQRTLSAAENGTLAVSWQVTGTLAVIESVVQVMQVHEVAAGRTLRIAPDTEDFSITTDPALLKRVLVNLTKNALEATPPDGTVTVGCRRLPAENAVEFRVHNPGVIPEDVQLQMFQRSFSTKGAGRGIGTHSVKLLTERYLQGTVRFTSTPDDGTTFYVCYPIDPRR